MKRIQKKQRSKIIIMVSIVLVLVCLGIGTLLISRAATSYGSSGAAQGTITTPATKHTDSSAYGGQSVVFGNSPPAPPVSTIPAEPTVSSDSIYPLEHVTSFAGGVLPSNLQAYGQKVLSPKGFIANSHLVPTATDLQIEGYPDPISGTVGGVTGAGFDLAKAPVETSGGFDICFSMSAGSWQAVHLVLISWPTDSTWAEGENDIFEGNPQSMSINLHEIGSTPKNVVFHTSWPAALGTGIHIVSARWDPVNGYRYYLDGQLIATAALSSSVTLPTTPHYLTMQMQDTNQASTSDETAYIYWAATYGYNPA